MVNPISGPFGSSADVSNQLAYKYRRWYKQAKPYNLTLGYEQYLAEVTARVASEGTFPFSLWSPSGHVLFLRHYTDNGISGVDNVTYAKLRGKLLAEKADLGVVLGEQASARKMITDRSRQLLQLSRFLRGGSVSDVDGWIATHSPSARRPRRGSSLPWLRRKLLRTPAGMASLWLEYSWGWSAAYEDITNALEVLVSPVLPAYVRASHQQTFELRQEDRRYVDELIAGYGYRNGTQKTIYNFTYTCASGCYVTVTNHNSLLLNRLGLINVAKTAWSVAPFSFLIDKYVNVGQMLGSLTDLYGLSLSQEWVTRTIAGTAVNSQDYVTFTGPSGSGTLVDRQRNAQITATRLKRRTTSGIVTPSFTYREPSVGSFSEAASYWALLIQLLSPK